MKKIILLSLLTFLLLSAGCEGSVEKPASKSPTKISDFQSISNDNKIPETPELAIKKTFIRETLNNLSSVNKYESLQVSLLNLEVLNTANKLRALLPEDLDEEKHADFKLLLKAYAGMVATSYCLNNKIMFDKKILGLLDKGNDHMCYGENVFEESNLQATAAAIALWHFNNYRISDGVFYSTHKDYTPYTEDEISLLIWAKILQDWSGNKYSSEIIRVMIEYKIYEREDDELITTDSWDEKLSEDAVDTGKGTYSLINNKYNLGFKPSSYSDLLLKRFENESYWPEYGFNSGLGLGGNIGGGDGPGITKEGPVIDLTKIETGTINEFTSEELLTLFEIKSLLASEEIKDKFRGIIHLFRYINENKDYSQINEILPAFETDNKQLNVYIFHKIINTTNKASSDEDKNYIKDFLYSLFANQIKNRSVYLEFILEQSDDEYTSKFVELLLADKIIESKNQSKLIKFIIKKKWDKYISRLFDWRFSKVSRDLEKFELITVDIFCEMLIKYSKDLFYTNTFRILKMLDYKDCRDVKFLGAYIFKKLTNTEIKPNAYFTTYYKVDPELLEKNQLYLKNVDLIKEKHLRSQFFNAIALNCSINLDTLLLKFIEKEIDEDTILFMTTCYVQNIFHLDRSLKFVDVKLPDSNSDEEQGEDSSGKTKQEIRADEIRFVEFAKIGISKDIYLVDYKILRVSRFMLASRGWKLIEQIIDKDRKYYDTRRFLELASQIKPDEMGLIEVGKQKTLLYKYLIGKTSNMKTAKLKYFIAALTIIAD